MSYLLLDCGADREVTTTQEDQLLVADPRALHDIVIRNTDIWEISDDIAERSRLVFGPGLFSAQGQEYKKQRKILKYVALRLCQCKTDVRLAVASSRQST